MSVGVQNWTNISKSSAPFWQNNQFYANIVSRIPEAFRNRQNNSLPGANLYFSIFFLLYKNELKVLEFLNYKKRIVNARAVQLRKKSYRVFN